MALSLAILPEMADSSKVPPITMQDGQGFRATDTTGGIGTSTA